MPTAEALVAHTDAEHRGDKAFTCRCCCSQFASARDHAEHAHKIHDEHIAAAGVCCCCCRPAGAAACCSLRCAGPTLAAVIFLILLICIAPTMSRMLREASQ